MEGRLPHIILVPGRHGGFRQGFAQIPGLAPGYSVDLPPAHRRPCLVAPHIDPPDDWPAPAPSGLPPGCARPNGAGASYGCRTLASLLPFLTWNVDTPVVCL